MNELRIGFVTIGQTPRNDIIDEIKGFTERDFEVLQCGALDGLADSEIASLEPDSTDVPLITRLRSGEEALVAKDKLVPLVQRCIDSLKRDKPSMIVFLCTEKFPTPESDIPLLFPCDLIECVVKAFIRKGNLAVLVPLKDQERRARDKWKKVAGEALVATLYPYADRENLHSLAASILDHHVDLILLDCMGYNLSIKEKIKTLTHKPVILPCSLIAYTIEGLI